MDNLLFVSVALTVISLFLAWLVQQIPGPDKAKGKDTQRYRVEVSKE